MYYTLLLYVLLRINHLITNLFLFTINYETNVCITNVMNLTYLYS
jgi:hypothetical protein